VGFCFLSHKVLRWIGPFLILLALFSSFILAFSSNFYGMVFLLQCMVLLAPLVDFILKRFGIHIKLLRLLTHFYAMNLALLIGFFKSLARIETGVWERTSRQ
jgi:hypothetical protein